MAIIGFLGSGKTSLLNHILSENQGVKVGVIVNDFGDINIDAMLVARQTDQELELSNGCICCTLEGNSLDDAIGQLAHAGSTIDYIIIEASGLAEPKELLRLLVNSKNQYARFDSLISVIDAVNILDTEAKHPGFAEQLTLADILIINKSDLIDKKQLKKVRDYLLFINSDARVITADHGKVDTRLLMDPESSEKPSHTVQLPLSERDDHSDHIHETYTTVSLKTDKPLDPKKWENWISNLPTHIYRIKGFVYFGMKGLEQKFLFQSVGGRHDMKIDEWIGKKPETSLVVIGSDFDKNDMQKKLQDLIDESPDDLNNETIMDVLRYR